jgi:hypothetical protein
MDVDNDSDRARCYDNLEDLCKQELSEVTVEVNET